MATCWVKMIRQYSMTPKNSIRKISMTATLSTIVAPSRRPALGARLRCNMVSSPPLRGVGSTGRDAGVHRNRHVSHREPVRLARQVGDVGDLVEQDPAHRVEGNLHLDVPLV